MFLHSRKLFKASWVFLVFSIFFFGGWEPFVFLLARTGAARRLSDLPFLYPISVFLSGHHVAFVEGLGRRRDHKTLSSLPTAKSGESGNAFTLPSFL